MVALQLFYDFHYQLGIQKHNLSTNTFKLMLTNTAPSISWTAISSATEITAGNGYTAGGISLTTSFTLAGSVGQFVISDYLLTASGGSIGPFQYLIVYNSSVGVSNNLIGWSDFGSPITITPTYTTLFDFPDVIIGL